LTARPGARSSLVPVLVLVPELAGPTPTPPRPGPHSNHVPPPFGPGGRSLVFLLPLLILLTTPATLPTPLSPHPAPTAPGTVRSPSLPAAAAHLSTTSPTLVLVPDKPAGPQNPHTDPQPTFLIFSRPGAKVALPSLQAAVAPVLRHWLVARTTASTNTAKDKEPCPAATFFPPSSF
jgi:hypothetical protein